MGGIAGGSAHKFGIFRRKESGQWVTGSPQSERAVSDAEAVAIARRNRDQLAFGVALLEKLPRMASDADCFTLQKELERQAPDLSGVGWAHKYLSLLFPEKLDDYHNERYQRFNLLKSLIKPPDMEGLYVCAGRFVQLAAGLGWPMNHLTTVLNERNGRAARYWRIGTRLGETASIWSAMREGKYVAIGWEEIGDLSALMADELREAIRERMQQYYPNDPNVASRKAGEVFNFVAKIEQDEIVVAADGQRVLGASPLR